MTSDRPRTIAALRATPEPHHGIERDPPACPPVEALRGGESLGRALIVLSVLAVILAALCIFLPAIFAGA